MAKKMPALQGPLKTWTTHHSWKFMHTWGSHRTLVHPYAVAIKLNERGEAAQECARLMRNHSYRIGAWYIIRAEVIPKLRPVWVAGFRRCPVEYELDQECILDAEQLQEFTRG